MSRAVAGALLLNALLGPGAALLADAQAIKLPGRAFEPAPGIEPELLRRLETPEVSARPPEGPASPVHAIVQTVRQPTPADRGRLAGAGVRLMTYLGSNAFYASLERKVDFEPLKDLVRWAGLLRSTDKIEPALLAERIEPWAKSAGGRIKILVSLHRDAGADAAPALKAKFPAGWRYLDGYSSWAAELTLEEIRNVAREETVRWIEQGPHPSMPLPAPPAR